MSIKINEKNWGKDFNISDSNEVVLKANKPKWYSNRIEFFYTNKKYQIFEIKTNYEADLDELNTNFPMNRTRFSKYCNGFEKFFKKI